MADFSEMSTEEVVAKILKFPAKNIVFTGGEPALFQEEIREIVKKLPEDFSFEIETNGSFLIADDFWNCITISPKLQNSGNRPYEIRGNSFPEKTVWKFVISQENDAKEVLEIQQKYEIPSEKIFVMPEGRTTEEIQKISEKALEIALKYNFRFSPRAHIWLFGNARGK